MYEITTLDKKMTAFVIPNAIQLSTRQNTRLRLSSHETRLLMSSITFGVWLSLRMLLVLGRGVKVLRMVLITVVPIGVEVLVRLGQLAPLE